MSVTPPAATASSTRTLTVALIGNPNTGKSTLFNALTGGKSRIGNFPGVTVEKKVGRFETGDAKVQLVDLPGTYSLAPRSADEMVSVDVLLGRQADIGTPDAVVCIVDASNLERNLYLFSQVRDMGLPVLLVLNMWDVALQNGVKVDLKQLKQQLGVDIVTTSAHRNHGVEEVRAAIISTARQPAPPAIKLFPEAFYQEVEQLGHHFRTHGLKEIPEFLLERIILDVHGEAEHRSAVQGGESLTSHLAEARNRLAASGCKVPLIETKARYDWIRRQLTGVIERTQAPGHQTTSDRIDRWLTHRFFGVLAFVTLMFVIFQTIYPFAEPLMGAIESAQEFMGGVTESLIPPGAYAALLVDGLIAGVGSVVVFLPQIALLFLFIAMMEDCGYMARAAFLMDKLMTKVGLSGKSFLPLMSSFACAIPGVMATRVIENRRDRMVTMLIAPLMSCSARLPVYLIMVAAFIPETTWAGGWIGLQGMVVFLMSSIGALIAIPIAWILKKTLFKGETPPFVMELPPYKWPSLKMVFHRVYDRCKAFTIQAGTLIFAVTVLVWAAGYFPVDHTAQHQLLTQIEEKQESLAEDESSPEIDAMQEEYNQISGELMRQSYLGRMGLAVEPVFKPLGWDWRIAIGAIASFPAREVIIATLGTIFSLGGDTDEESPELMGALQSATWPDGSPLITIPVALSIMVFFALCAQCGATLMVMKRETNSWRWPIFTFAYMTTLAYVAAWLTFRIGTSLMS